MMQVAWIRLDWSLSTVASDSGGWTNGSDLDFHSIDLSLTQNEWKRWCERSGNCIGVKTALLGK